MQRHDFYAKYGFYPGEAPREPDDIKDCARDSSIPEMKQAMQGLTDALKQMLAVFPPEFDEKWVESSGEKIQVQAWNQARAALEGAKPFLDSK